MTTTPRTPPFDKVTLIDPDGMGTTHTTVADDPQVAELLAAGWMVYRRWTVYSTPGGGYTSEELEDRCAVCGGRWHPGTTDHASCASNGYEGL